jgi:hypothetical protein
MHGYGGGDGVGLRVDDGDRAHAPNEGCGAHTVDEGCGFCAGIYDVDLVEGGAGGDGDGVLADGDFAVEAEIDYVEDGDGVALAVGDVGVFAEIGWVLGEFVGVAGG